MPHHQAEKALEIVRKLRGAGFEALFAGGCVRDQLLGRTPKDYDVATNARPEEVRQLFGFNRTLAIGAAFGVIGVTTGRGRDPIEVATFRTDGEYLDGRHPESVTFSSAELDAQRRDFTINGLFFDPIEQQVVDYVGGREDLAAQLIRAIGSPQARFQEDKLRMLRAVRFATTYQFTIEPETLAAIQAMADEVTYVSAERIGAELERILKSPQRSLGVQLLAKSALLEPLLPELADDAAAGSACWHETLATLQRLESSELSTALATLWVGRGDASLLGKVGKRLRYPNREIERAQWMLTNLPQIERGHLIPWPQLQRLLVHDAGEELLRLASACWGNAHPGVAQATERLRIPPEQLNPAPLLTGDDLIARGMSPGKHFATLLEAVRDAQLDGKVSTPEEAWEYCRRWQKQNNDNI